jgi:hypothetical protein
MPGSHGSPAVAMKLEAKKALRMTAIFVFTFYKKKYLKGFGHFSTVYYHTLFQDPKLNVVNFAPTSNVRLSFLLLLKL